VAIYHFSAKVIGRSTGRSAVAAAAYRAAELLHDERLGRDHDFTAKAGVVHSEILLPEGAPERWLDRAALWNEVEDREKQHNAQLARDIELALPRELSKAEAIALARDFVREQFVARGMVADLNVHWGIGADGEAQPHAHVMLTMRKAEKGPEGEGRFGLKERAWNDRGLLVDWRERWAEVANARLHQLGHDARIDHRSYAEQGIPLEPQHKIGPAGQRRAERGENAERRAEHDEIARRNGARIAEDPTIALDALTRQHSTFTKQDLARFVSRHTDGAEQFASVLAKVEASPELVRLGVDGRGRERFSTREMVAAERRMEEAAAELAERRRHRVSDLVATSAELGAAARGRALGDEQRWAMQHALERGDLALVVGYAGTGKSAMLGVAREAWEAAGYRVRGAALSGIAAESLEAGSGIQSRTLASLEWGWAEGREADRLNAKDVLVVDEAGMVGSRQMERVLAAARAAGAKVVLVGDPEQLQAIEAGAAFRAIAERHGAVEISEVRRQHEDWQREATRELATGRTRHALERYEGASAVQAHATKEAARAALIAGWAAERTAAPEQSRVILAYTRDDVAALNRLARERLRDAGELGSEQAVQTERGERAMAAGDRIMFLRNERGLGAEPGERGGAAVKNGTLGTVLAVEAEGERLTVRLDGPGQAGEKAAPVVTFSLRDYGHVDHGYAATIHKAQGVTVDRTHVLASQHMDRHASYVALTRHREGVSLHYGQDEFSDTRELARVLGRERRKDTTLDYGAGQEPDHVAAYAERRGFNPLHPVSEIVVRQAEPPAPEAPRPEPDRAKAGQGFREGMASGAQPDPVMPPPAPKRSKFAGLKLGKGPSAPERAEELAMPALSESPTPQAETRNDRLARGLSAYARAWSDAARMERAGLPVLPHQVQALERAGQDLEAINTGLSRDVRATLDRTPELAQGIGQPAGMAALGNAVGQERRGRLALEERGRAMVRAWDAMEGAYEAAGKTYDWDAQREVGTRMEAFARALKRDPQLDGLLRERGPDLGIVKGSRLDQVVQAREIDRTLTRSMGLDHGPRMRSGPSLGM
jgi:Ti-type conjugative transfer relaxase TraA